MEGGRGRVYTYRYTVTTRMTCIKMGSDESHSVNVSLIVRDKVEAVSNRGPSAYQPTALPLGQTGSHYLISVTVFSFRCHPILSTLLLIL